MAKGPEAFRSISEASAELGVPSHVLRFWETRFSFVRPMKRAGGRRFYRRQDLDMLRGVRALLHEEGYTIKGVQRLHREEGLSRLLSAGARAESEAEAEPPADGPAADALHSQPPPAAPLDPPASGPQPALGAQARRRLGAVLHDLETAKHHIDRLLPPAPDW